jgi:hypothetical protein
LTVTRQSNIIIVPFRHRPPSLSGKGGISLNQEDIIIHLTANEHEIGSLRHRVNKMESQVDAINKLTVSVNTLAGSVRDLLEVQKSQNERLRSLELRPAKEARTWRNEVIRAIASALAGTLIGALIAVVTHAQGGII